MNEITLEWIEKAEGDFNAASVLRHVRKLPNHDLVCFLSQQTAEKYLKAFLQEHEQPIPKIHDLANLARRCAESDASFALQEDLLKFLDDFSVRYRYPGEKADKELATEAYRRAKAFRLFVRERLGID